MNDTGGSRSRARRAGVLAAVAAGAALLIAACGGGNSRTVAGTTALKFVACMRTHGIPDMPDPVVQDGGVVIHGGGSGPNSPQNKSARQACQSFLTGLGGGS